MRVGLHLTDQAQEPPSPSRQPKSPLSSLSAPGVRSAAPWPARFSTRCSPPASRPKSIVQARGPQISGQDELLAIARQVIQENPQAVQDYRDGKGRALQFLMGQVMRITRGKANPRAVSTLIRTQLDAET